MALILTFPEKVTKFNFNYLKKLIINGPDKYPGAHSIISKSGEAKFTLSIDNRRRLADQL